MHAAKKRIALFGRTHDYHAQPLDENRTRRLMDLFLKGAAGHKNLEIVDSADFTLAEKSNESLRVAIYRYHQENHLNGIMGMRVIGDRSVPIMYPSNDSQANVKDEHLFAELSKLFSPLDKKAVSLEASIVYNFDSQLSDRLLGKWMQKKGIINLRAERLGEYVPRLLEHFGRLSEVLSKDYHDGKKVERRRAHDVCEELNRLVKNGAITGDYRGKLKDNPELLKKFAEHKQHEHLKDILSPSYGRNKQWETHRTHEINKVLDNLLSGGYINEDLHKKLKSDREFLKRYVSEESPHNLIEAARLISNALWNSIHSYKNSLGIDLNRIIMAEMALIVNNEVYKQEYRDILSSEMEEIGRFIDGYRQTERMPLYYVPMREPNGQQEWEKPPGFLPCTDIQLTVSVADSILSSKQLQHEFVRAITEWGSRL